MTIAEDIARMKLLTLHQYQASYERAVNREPPGPQRELWQQTLDLLNAALARHTKTLPF